VRAAPSGLLAQSAPLACHNTVARLFQSRHCAPMDKPWLIRRSRELRATATFAERALWEALRGRQAAGAKFRRQHRILRYIADFACVDARLVVELDGGSHEAREWEDLGRTAEIEAAGWRVVRLPNDMVINRIEDALEVIAEALALPHG
jgi:very-short-patch-repair endonuclease